MAGPLSAEEGLIRRVEAAGGVFETDGEKLRIFLPKELTSLRRELQLHKWEIITTLAHRPVMPPGIRLLHYQPLLAPVRLSAYETVISVDGFVRSTLEQISARLIGRSFLAGNRSLSDLLERLAAVGCRVALDDSRKMLQ